MKYSKIRLIRESKDSQENNENNIENHIVSMTVAGFRSLWKNGVITEELFKDTMIRLLNSAHGEIINVRLQC
jgi:hypothetical protein